LYAVMDDDEHERKGQERGGLEVMVGVVVVLMALTVSSTSQGADQVQTMVMLAIMCVTGTTNRHKITPKP